MPALFESARVVILEEEEEPYKTPKLDDIDTLTTMTIVNFPTVTEPSSPTEDAVDKDTDKDSEEEETEGVPEEETTPTEGEVVPNTDPDTEEETTVLVEEPKAEEHGRDVSDDIGDDIIEVTSATASDNEEIQTTEINLMDWVVQYQGRDILDLSATLTSSTWDLQYAVLPPMNLQMFWKNRSQYHRLGNYGEEECNMAECLYCSFQYILSKK